MVAHRAQARPGCVGSQALLLPGSQRRPAELAALTPVRSPAPATQSGEPITATRTITYILRFAQDRLYDPLNRLTGAYYSTGECFEYQYDAAGNRIIYTATVESTTVTTYTYNAANRLTKVGNVVYTWDARGNLLSDGTFTYTYNAAGRDGGRFEYKPERRIPHVHAPLHLHRRRPARGAIRSIRSRIR
ncbi:MAG: hypothetical protein JXA21_08930 [Anaerolineae bacterium]|nr:hypothetical protein [Anaerolineae bacterium]